METISKHGFGEVVRLWNLSGRRIWRLLLDVANHGVNDVELWMLNEQGIYLPDGYEDFRRVVEFGELEFDRNIPQV